MARWVLSASGPLNRPKLPGIPGIDTFKGHTFHTSRWDYAYTGGDSRGAMTGLAGKRIANIGPGATAIQCVPSTSRQPAPPHRSEEPRVGKSGVCTGKIRWAGAIVKKKN